MGRVGLVAVASVLLGGVLALDEVMGVSEDTRRCVCGGCGCDCDFDTAGGVCGNGYPFCLAATPAAAAAPIGGEYKGDERGNGTAPNEGSRCLSLSFKGGKPGCLSSSSSSSWCRSWSGCCRV